MTVLKITQTKLNENRFRATMSVDDGREANIEFDFTFTPDEQNKVRWYLEKYLENPYSPNDQRARSVEQLMQAKGTQLFEIMMNSDDQARDIWFNCKNKLGDTRVEIQTSIEAATAIPWELLYIPQLKTYLTLEAQSFVRSYRGGVRETVSQEQETVRVLLVICRPKLGDDVAFRSVASRILKSLGMKIGEHVELEVLRPPTFAELAKRLRKANRIMWCILMVTAHMPKEQRQAAYGFHKININHKAKMAILLLKIQNANTTLN